MAENKLQELTEKLYNEGLSKGREEGERILAEARENAEKTISDAKAQARAIVEKAEKDAAALRSKTEADVRTASELCLQASRKDIENLIVGKISADRIQDSLADAAFIKEAIMAVCRQFNASGATDMALVLPENLRKETEGWVAGELSKTLGAKVSANFSRKISGGFTIGPSDGSYFISLTDETFKELIAEYLRPSTRKLLFGE